MTNNRKKISLLFGFCLLVFALASCAHEVLYNQLTQEDANKVMVLLQQQGLHARLEEEVVQNETFWTVLVPKEEMARARELIVTSQIISPRSPGLKEVYQAKGGGGWIKTPAEERARYLLALKGEIVNSLKKLPNVVDVDVVLNVPQEDDFGMKERKRPTASVVIKAQSPTTGETALNEVQIQQFVSNSIEGMSARDVSVLLHFVAPMGTRLKPGQTVLLPKGPQTGGIPTASEGGEKTDVPLMGLQLDAASKDRLKIYLIIFFAVLVVLSVALIMSILQLSHTRQELKGLKGGAHPALKSGQPAEGGSPRLETPEEKEAEALEEEEP